MSVSDLKEEKNHEQMQAHSHKNHMSEIVVNTTQMYIHLYKILKQKSTITIIPTKQRRRRRRKTRDRTLNWHVIAQNIIALPPPQRQALKQTPFILQAREMDGDTL